MVDALPNVTATGDHAVHAPCIPGSLLSVISEVTEELQDFTYKLAQNQIDLMSEMVCATALNANNGPFSQLRQTLAQAVAIVSSNAQQQLVNGGGLAVHKWDRSPRWMLDTQALPGRLMLTDLVLSYHQRAHRRLLHHPR